MLTNVTALVSSSSTTGHSYLIDKGVNIEYLHQLACLSFACIFLPLFLLLIYDVVKYMSTPTNIMIYLLLLVSFVVLYPL